MAKIQLLNKRLLAPCKDVPRLFATPSLTPQALEGLDVRDATKALQEREMAATILAEAFWEWSE